MWMRRKDLNNVNWFKVLKDIKITVAPAPTPGGQITTGVATQATIRDKYYTLRIPMNKIMKFVSDTQTGYQIGAIPIGTKTTSMNYSFYMGYWFDNVAGVAYQMRHYYRNIPQ